MNTYEILNHVEAGRQDEAATPEEAADRIAVRLLCGLIREHLDRAHWNEGKATELEKDLSRILEKHGWTDAADTEES